MHCRMLVGYCCFCFGGYGRRRRRASSNGDCWNVVVVVVSVNVLLSDVRTPSQAVLSFIG